MKIWSALVSVVILGGLLSLNPGLSAAPLVPPTGSLLPPRVDPLQWSIEGTFPTGTIRPGQAFALRNTVAAKFLRFANETPTWQDAPAPFFQARSVGTAIAPLRYLVGPVAIMAQGRYLRSTSPGSRQPVMLSDVPSYEWLITGGAAAAFVLVAQPVGFRNVIKGDEVVLCPGQAPGALSLVWADECGGHTRQVEPPTGVSLATPTPRPTPVSTVSATPIYPGVHAGAVQWGVRLDDSTLSNRVTNKYLTYGIRTFGINLVWSGYEQTKYFPARFEDQLAGAVWPPRVRFFRPTALHMSAHPNPFVKYGERSVGVNLVWSGSPVYEWAIHVREGVLPGSALRVFPGTELPTRSVVRVALYNKRVNDYLVYCERDYGINLKWLKDCPSRYPSN